MSDRSAAELEADAELARARVADTAESIRNKMSPGQLFDEFSGLFSGGEGASALSSLKTQVRQNPLAVSLVGAGIAWLMFGSGGSGGGEPSNQSSSSTGRKTASTWDSEDFSSEAPSTWDTASSHLDTGSLNYSDDDDTTSSQGEKLSAARDTVSSARDKVSSLAESAAAIVKDTVSGAGSRVSETVSGVGNRVSETVSGAGERLSQGARRAASGTTSRATSGFQAAQDLISREPLALAALGVVVGTAIGVLLPHSEVEDKQLGKMSGQLREKAKDIFEKGTEEAKDIAAGAYESLKNAADMQAGSGEGGSFAQKVGDVLKTVASETEEAVRERLPGNEDTQQS